MLQTIGGAGIIVQRARLAADGKTVLVHKLGRDPRAFEAMKLALRYAVENPRSSGGALLDVVDEGESTYIVTEDRPECLSLMDWLPWALAGGKSASKAETETSTTDSKAGEFTRVFAPPASRPAEKGVLRPTRLDTSAPELHTRIQDLPASAPSGEPGEFTRLFRNAPAHGTEGLEGGSTASSGSASPGEFTSLFGGTSGMDSTENVPGYRIQRPQEEAPVKRPEPQRPFSSSDPAAPAAEPGEFTRLFRNPDADASRGVPRVAPPRVGSRSTREESAPPQAPAPSGPGEFTRIIRRPAAQEPAAAESASSEDAQTPAAAPDLPKPQMPAFTPPAVPRAPGITVPQTPALKPAPAPIASAAEYGPAKGRRVWPFVVLFGILTLVAIALIVVFVLRR